MWPRWGCEFQIERRTLVTLINLQDVAVTLSEPLFADLSLTLAKSDRLGIVAANGRGKSTLLGILAGHISPTSGDITTARGLRAELVPQDLPDELRDLCMFDAVLAGIDEEQAEFESWRVNIALEDLHVPADIWQTPIEDLSGGWQRVALLARAWVREPDVLLIDEPTNHLDLHRIGVLQTWLSTVARRTACVIASHDRAFLDTVTNRTLFLRPQNSPQFALPYSAARVAVDEADAADARRFENEVAKADQLRRQAAKLKNVGINSGSDLLLTKTKQLQERANKLERSARPAHVENSAGKIRLSNSGTHAKALVTFEEAEITTPDGAPLFKTGQMWINRGDRIIVQGANGSGKSCLLSLVITALAEPQAGLRVAPTVVPGVSDQSLSQLDPFKSPLDAVLSRSDVGDQNARTLLASAGIRITHQSQAINRLSGGQQSRLAMLILRLTHPNFYILDEPTNHLDIEGQEALEVELQKHDATALLVSHDRSFVRNVGTRFWQINRARLIETDSPEAFFVDQLGEDMPRLG